MAMPEWEAVVVRASSCQALCACMPEQIRWRSSNHHLLDKQGKFSI
jgi:hypothetical protein